VARQKNGKGEGMNRRELRDHYAGLAMQGLVIAGYKTIGFVCREGYATAEAMLAERDKRYGRVVPDGTDEPIREGE